jgi:hypothetical protein
MLGIGADDLNRHLAVDLARLAVVADLELERPQRCNVLGIEFFNSHVVLLG